MSGHQAKDKKEYKGEQRYCRDNQRDSDRPTHTDRQIYLSATIMFDMTNEINSEILIAMMTASDNKTDRHPLNGLYS